MNVFYNVEGVGDTLIMVIQDGELENRTFETKGDLVRIYDKVSGETLGYNLFKASTYGELVDNGALELTEDVQALIQKAFKENRFDLNISLKKQAKFVVGYVEEKVKHPNADKLNICHVNVGDERLQIVCGAPNVDQGQKVVVARVGAVMPSGLVIKEAALRGVESSGMICSAKELALPNAPQEKGILVLEDTYEVGLAFPMS
jgi:tRNA-binding protein